MISSAPLLLAFAFASASASAPSPSQSQSQSPPQAVAVKDVSAPNAHELQPRAVRASSFLKNGWNAAEENYLPTYVADDNAKTAWVEGAVDDGAGEWLEWTGPRLAKAKRYVVFVKNGYQKSKALYEANSRATRMRVELVVDGKALATPVDVKLADVMGWQRFDVPVTAGAATSALRFTLVEIAAGKKYTDTCLSDLRVFVEGDDPYSAPAEALAQEEVRRFAAERATAAKQLRAMSTKGAPSLLMLTKAPESSPFVANAPVLPKASAPPSPMTNAVDWRRVGAELPPGARAAADALGDSLEPLHLLYPFLQRDGVTYFDEPTTRFAELERAIEVSDAKEERAKTKFIAACERERRKSKSKSSASGEGGEGGVGCSCDDEFYGCGGIPQNDGEAGRLRMKLEGARISGVFLPVAAPLLNPSKVLVVNARYAGDRNPMLMRVWCLIDYSGRETTAACESDAGGAATLEAYRVTLDDAGHIAALYGGSPGAKADQVWTLAVMRGALP